MNRYLTLISILFMLTFWMAGCATQQPPVTSDGGLVTDYVSLVDNLRTAGATVEAAEEILQPFFSVKGNAITINGENVQVFEYSDSGSADTEAALVSLDGIPTIC